MTITPEALTGIAAAILALAFEYIPGLESRYGKLIPQHKALTMGGLLLLSAAIIFGLGCGNVLDAGMTCDTQGAFDMFLVFLVSAGVNQGVFLLIKKRPPVDA